MSENREKGATNEKTWKKSLESDMLAAAATLPRSNITLVRVRRLEDCTHVQIVKIPARVEDEPPNQPKHPMVTRSKAKHRSNV
jgi:hypothetical protein